MVDVEAGMTWRIVQQPLRGASLRHVCIQPRQVGHVDDVRLVNVSSIGEPRTTGHTIEETKIAYAHLPCAVTVAIAACPVCKTVWIEPSAEEEP